MKLLIVLGAGESGLGAALLGKKQGYQVLVSDKGIINENIKKELQSNEIEWEENKHSFNRFSQADCVVKSPGIPNHLAFLKKLKKESIPVISEIEFASWFCKGKIIAITGSNGKTTTTLLTAHILKQAGLDVAVCGNIGDSFAKQVAIEDKPYYVVELSSFQLDDIINFRPNIAILNNITPDHLDRYNNDFKLYAKAKFKIFENQTKNDVAVINGDDDLIIEMSHLIPKEVEIKKFSLDKKEIEGAYLEKENIIINIKNDRTIMSIHDLALKGRHNVRNTMAASIASRVFELRKDTIRESLSDFENAEHRLEHVATIQGVDFINDSKATNVNSTWFALDSVQKPVVWIVGGVDKGNDYSELSALVKERVKGIVCLGKNNLKIIESFQNTVDSIVETDSAKDAVEIAAKMAETGDAVLLSPACASFDLFDNYEDRGNRFKLAVRNL